MKLKKLVSAAVCAAMLSALVFTGCSSSGGGDAQESGGGTTASSEDGWAMADDIVKEVAENEPKFADYKVNITDFGAEVLTEKLTDKTEEYELAKKNNEAINKAIADVTAHEGGGTVTVPKGYTYTGAIHLDNNVELHLEDDATILFTTDYAQYPNVLTRWEGVVCYNYSPMIYAYQKENIAVTGNGTLDAQATVEEYWLPWKNSKYLPDEVQTDDQMALRKMGEDQTPVEERVFGQGHYLRPCFVQYYECEKCLLSDVKITNSPMWMVQPVFCKYFTARNVTVESHGYNNDGINPDSCNMAVIENCTFNTGDDCIAIKSGRDNDGRTIGIPSEKIVCRNNTYITGKGSCATVGSEMSGGVRDIFFLDNKSEETVEHLQAVSIKTNGDRGGTIENIYIKNTQADNVVDRAVLITKHYEEGDTGATTPEIKNIYIEGLNVKCLNPDGEVDNIAIWGYDRSPISGVHFKDCSFEGTDAYFNLHNVEGLTLEGCTFNGEAYPDGERVPTFEVVRQSVSGTSITIEYSCGAIEEDIKLTWLESDTGEDGSFTEVADNGDNIYKTMGSSGAMATLLKADTTKKYYKLRAEFGNTTWEGEALHLEPTN